MQASEQDGMCREIYLAAVMPEPVSVCVLMLALQVRFNVLRVLPRTGKAVKGFQKF